MKIAVFGATGRTGHLVVQKALDAGYEVVAYARSPHKLLIQSDHLTIIAGTLDDTQAIEQAVRGVDVVIELIGASSDGTEKILAAMKAYGVRRIIAASALSLSDPNDRFDVRRELLYLFVRIVIPGAVQQVIRAGHLVRTSGLDWTLVRISVLNDDPGTGRVISGYMGTKTVGFKLSRADLAEFFVQQITDTTCIRKAPAISSS